MYVKLFKEAVFTAVAASVLEWVLPHRHGLPFGLYALGTVGCAGLGLFCLWAVAVKHKSVYPDHGVSTLFAALGTPFLCAGYALSAVAAWRGAPNPNNAFVLGLIGAGIWLIGIIGAIRELRLKA